MENIVERVIYLGPTGSYSQIAAQKFCAQFAPDAKQECFSTITKIVQEIDKNEDLFAVLPIENSIEGVVRETIDNLAAAKNNPQIISQTVISIQHCLINKGKKEDIKHIISHPQALSQCSNYIAKNFGNNINVISANSTSHATSLLLDKDSSYASIANEFCAQLYDINIIERNINDVEKNFTRFVYVGRKPVANLPKTRTSIAFSTKNRPGALLEILKIFEKHNLNLVYLESRPSKQILGEYIFFADIDRGEDEIRAALDEIRAGSDFYKFFGSYSLLP